MVRLISCRYLKKGPADFVTAADIRTEKLLREELTHARPSSDFLWKKQENSSGEDPHRRWIIDPIDGTTNFVHGIAQFAISIAAEENGEITAGLIFEPINEELFRAERGQGPISTTAALGFHPGQRWHNPCSQRAFRSWAEAQKTTMIGFGGDEGGHVGLGGRQTVRRCGLGSCSCRPLADFDGFWESGLQPWDMAAGILIVREAGGLVSDLSGRQLHVRSLAPLSPPIRKPATGPAHAQSLRAKPGG